MLLQIDAMADATFTLKDVIYIIGFILSIAGGYFKLTASSKAINIRTKNLEVKQAKDDAILHNRINKTQEDMKEYITKSDAEFKEINKHLNTIIALVKPK